MGHWFTVYVDLDDVHYHWTCSCGDEGQGVCVCPIDHRALTWLQVATLFPIGDREPTDAGAHGALAANLLELRGSW